MAKFLDSNGLLYLWGKIKSTFVAKDGNKVLSTNDYTTAEKTKLAGIETGANKTTVEDSLTSTSGTNALSANKGRELNERIDGILGDMGDLGAGDMLKAVYDTNGDGVVDKAANANMLGGQPPTYYAKASDVPTVTNDYTDAEKGKVSTAYTHAGSPHAPSNAERNVVVGVKVNGTALTPDTSRNVNVTVPTKVSDLTNDSGYLTEHQDISNLAPKATTLSGYGITNAYTKTEADSKIATAVANAGHLKRAIVASLPTVTSADVNTIYMVLEDSASGNNKYIEWMVINGAWEKTGDTDVDLSGYWQTSALTAITNAEIDTVAAS